MGTYGTYDYTCDKVDNHLTSVETIGDWVCNANDELQTVNDEQFFYDANGNTTNITDMTNSRDLFYNQNNRLVRVEENSDIWDVVDKRDKLFSLVAG